VRSACVTIPLCRCMGKGANPPRKPERIVAAAALTGCIRLWQHWLQQLQRQRVQLRRQWGDPSQALRASPLTSEAVALALLV
jgi:hypothetical protein